MIYKYESKIPLQKCIRNLCFYGGIWRISTEFREYIDTSSGFFVIHRFVYFENLSETGQLHCKTVHAKLLHSSENVVPVFQTAHFSPFLSFHVLMYASVIINAHTIFINPDLSGIQSLISIPFFYFNYIILSLIFFDLFVVVFQVTNVYSKTCDIHMSRRNIKCVLIVVLMILRMLLFGEVLVLSISDCKIRFDFLNVFIPLINLFC